LAYLTAPGPCLITVCMKRSFWYALVSRPSGERKAHDFLTREHAKTWLPFTRVRSLRNVKGRQVVRWTERPTYPRYLFINVAPQRLWLARKAQCSVVAYRDGTPTIIPDAVMQVVQAGHDPDTGLAAGKAEVKRARFKAWQQVRIKN
jgi:hypothetical protein